VTAFQIEWNKLHLRLAAGGAGVAALDDGELATMLGIELAGVITLRAALGAAWSPMIERMARGELDLTVRLLGGSFREYERSAQRWWNAIEAARPELARRPVYFVSSNSHSLANLLGGYAFAHRDKLLDFVRRTDFEGLAGRLDEAVAAGDELITSNILYYALRAYLRDGGPDRLAAVQDHDAAAGITTVESPGRIDVSAQVIELDRLDLRHVDPRLRVPGMEALTRSNAVIVNIDYPLGMAAYHHLTAIGTGIDEVRGIYVMGKAATLNGRVGDVMISKVVHDEHSANTYLIRNSITAADVQPFMRYGTVLDNQKALTVRSAFLQNRNYMDVFYREGYTVMEMEAGPYLSSVYETSAPQRHPKNEIVNLSDLVPFDLGIIHYASDTPYSRRQSLLSKSLSFFGMESTYGCALAIGRRILQLELGHQARAS
jgi:hypothetical protein